MPSSRHSSAVNQPLVQLYPSCIVLSFSSPCLLLLTQRCLIPHLLPPPSLPHVCVLQLTTGCMMGRWPPPSCQPSADIWATPSACTADK